MEEVHKNEVDDQKVHEDTSLTTSELDEITSGIAVVPEEPRPPANHDNNDTDDDHHAHNDDLASQEAVHSAVDMDSGMEEEIDSLDMETYSSDADDENEELETVPVEDSLVEHSDPEGHNDERSDDESLSQSSVSSHQDAMIELPGAEDREDPAASPEIHAPMFDNDDGSVSDELGLDLSEEGDLAASEDNSASPPEMSPVEVLSAIAPMTTTKDDEEHKDTPAEPDDVADDLALMSEESIDLEEVSETMPPAEDQHHGAPEDASQALPPDEPQSEALEQPQEEPLEEPQGTPPPVTEQETVALSGSDLDNIIENLDKSGGNIEATPSASSDSSTSSDSAVPSTSAPAPASLEESDLILSQEFKELFQHLDDLMAHLPKEKVADFARSKHFKKYTHIVNKISKS